MKALFAVLIVFVLECSPEAYSQPPNYGFDMVTIGAAGNRPASQAEAPDLFPPNVSTPIITGGVNYEYQISRTEVTAAQWLEFANAYWPYSNLAPDNPNMTGFWIRAANTMPGQNPGYYILPGAANHPTDTSWQMAARYVNWLSNGKAHTASAFETGAYDTSTFTRNPDGSWNDQLTHSANASYWIPTLDEWTKAMYYDRNKNGSGKDGYWRYPTTSDSAPIPGWPGEGGQTSAGLELFSGPWLDVGSYPGVTSPWGLLDGSGSQSEWTELMTQDHRTRYYKGTEQFFPMPDYYDRIDYLFGTTPDFPNHGFRIASALPSPATMSVAPAAAWGLSKRRRS